MQNLLSNNSQQIANIAEESYRVDSNFAIVPEKKESKFSYDANGNLLGIYTGTKQGDKLKVTNTRTMLWDEENHLLATCDNGYLTAYWYDAAGERTVKMSGDGEGVNINGVVSAGRTGTANFTAYVNPYLVVRNGGEYTKHIYMGGQRITSKVSNSGIFSTSPVKDTLQAKYTLQTASLKSRYDSLNVQYKGTEHSGSIISNAPTTASSSYFYHSDHLGSSSLITDLNGEIVQHVEYVPFGETFIDERRSASSWTTPYLFSGKQRDEETGLIYFGARYYDPKTSVWLSVDPLAEKMPSVSSYTYCFNNPIKFIDIDGLIPWPVISKIEENLRRITSGMFRNDGGARHGAVDIAFKKNGKGINLNVNSTVVATHTGTINIYKNRGKAGNYITITNGKLRTRYLHLKSSGLGGNFKNGETVKEGEEIGFLGQSGTTNPHLHYEIQMLVNGDWVGINPVVDEPDKVSSSDIVELKDPQKMLGLPSINDNNTENSNDPFTFSAPNWAKKSKIGALVYFLFTGKDSGLPDQLQ